jgi:hypothetical protein
LASVSDQGGNCEADIPDLPEKISITSAHFANDIRLP